MQHRILIPVRVDQLPPSFHIISQARLIGRLYFSIYVQITQITIFPAYVKHSIYNHKIHDLVQGSAKRWTLGCMNPASWLPLAAGGMLMQPRAHLLADP